MVLSGLRQLLAKLHSKDLERSEENGD